MKSPDTQPVTPVISIPAGALRVPQRTYAIAVKGSGVESLVTKRLLTCMALAGVDNSKGIAFLAHFDTLCSSGAIPRLIEDLRRRSDDDLSGFELHEVASFSPWIPTVFLAALPFAWLFSWYLFGVCVVVGAFMGSTRLMVWWQLRQLRRKGILVAKCTRHRPMGFFNLFGRAMCWIDCKGNFEASREVHGYEPPARSFPWLVKASGSI